MILAGVLALIVAGITFPRIYLYLWPPPARSIRLPPTYTPFPTRSPAPSPSPTDTPTAVGGLAACLGRLTEILNQTQAAGSGRNDPQTQESHVLVTYQVDGDRLSDPSYATVSDDLVAEQQDTARQEAIWHFVTDVLPADQRTRLTQYVLFTDGPGNSLGAIMRTDNPHKWMLRLDIVDAADFSLLSTTVMHEFGHLLTLNDSQVTISYQPYDPQATGCPNYFMPEGCSQPEAYINRFYQRFWPDISLEWRVIAAEQDADARRQKLIAFYRQYSDQFVSPYAATDPGEDIAEAWMYFIFTPRPDGTSVADQKIRFFYEYPKLVELRTAILDHLCSYVK